jgi:gluconolactonase
MKPHPLTFCFVVAFTSATLAFAQEPNYPTPPEAERQEGVPVGTLTRGTFADSKIYPGTTRDYAIYIPQQYQATDDGAALMVFQDGDGFCNDRRGSRAHIVFDNLIHEQAMPVTIGLFINPGVMPPLDPEDGVQLNRSIEYDVVSDAYARFLIEEFIPYLEQENSVKISRDPNKRGLCGSSSGAIAAFTAAWHRPDSFRRVYSLVGTYTAHRNGHDYPTLVRRTEPKPLRVFMQGNTDDLDLGSGDWWIANLSLFRALEFSGYEVDHRWGEGGHNQNHGASIFPEVMRWLWKTETVSAHPDKYRSSSRNFIDLTADWEVVSEGHHWAEGMVATADGTLFFTDVPAGKLYKIAPDGTRSVVDDDTGKANGLALGPDGRIYGAAGGAKEIRAWDPESGKRETIAAGTHANDLVVHHQGHIYYTDPQAGKVWHVAPGSREPQPADPNFPNPNGITLSADHSMLYVTDFSGRYVYSYQIQPDGSLKYKIPFFHAQLPSTTGHAHLDGLCVNSSGNLLVSSSQGLQIFDPRGRILIVLPRPHVTDNRINYVTFGGPDRKTLYIATSGTIYKRPAKSFQGVDPTRPYRPSR